MRYIAAFVLAALAAISFCSNAEVGNLDDGQWVPAKNESTVNCAVGDASGSSMPIDVCLSKAAPSRCTTDPKRARGCNIRIVEMSWAPGNFDVYEDYEWCGFTDENGDCKEWSGQKTYDWGSYGVSTPNYSCPPDDNPDAITASPDQTQCWLENPVALPEQKECPSGYSKYEVNGQCVPTDCPPLGAAGGFMNGSGAALTCSNGCAYNYSEGGVAYSMGMTCDADGVEDSESGNCSVDTNGWGGEHVTCPDWSDPDSAPPKEQDPVDGEGHKSDPEENGPTEPDPECDLTDGACQTESVVTAIKNQTKELKTKLDENHNKSVDQREENTNALIGGLNNINETLTEIRNKTGTVSGGGAGSDTQNIDVDIDLSPIIDESTMPDTEAQLSTVSDDLLGQLDSEYSDLQNNAEINQTAPYRSLTGNPLDTYTNQLASKLGVGQCNNFDFGHGVVIDICSKQPLIEAVLTFIFCFYTFFRVKGQIKEVLTLVPSKG